MTLKNTWYQFQADMAYSELQEIQYTYIISILSMWVYECERSTSSWEIKIPKLNKNDGCKFLSRVSLPKGNSQTIIIAPDSLRIPDAFYQTQELWAFSDLRKTEDWWSGFRVYI